MNSGQLPAPAADPHPLRGSLVPPKPIRTLRNLTRYRKTQINDRSREVARLHKILEDTGIKLGCVASNIIGKSGATCSTRSCPGPLTPPCSPISRGDIYARRSRAQAGAGGTLRG
jgi:transposase